MIMRFSDGYNVNIIMDNEEGVSVSYLVEKDRQSISAYVAYGHLDDVIIALQICRDAKILGVKLDNPLYTYGDFIITRIDRDGLKVSPGVEGNEYVVLYAQGRDSWKGRKLGSRFWLGTSQVRRLKEWGLPAPTI